MVKRERVDVEVVTLDGGGSGVTLDGELVYMGFDARSVRDFVEEYLSDAGGNMGNDTDDCEF